MASSVDFALALCRFTHFASTMLLFGTILYIEALTPAPSRRDLRGRFAPFAVPLALLALTSAMAWFALVAWSISGDEELNASAALAVLTGTEFGHVWAMRVTLLVALAALCVLQRGCSASGLALSTLALASLSLTGHAAMQDGSLGVVHLANDACHLLLTASWIGGLLPFFVCLQLAGSSETRSGALAAMMRFSFAGHFTTPLIFVTGVVNLALTTGAVPWPINSKYRAILGAKIIIFAVMVSIAIANRYFLIPRLRKCSFADTALRTMTLAEWLLSLFAVATVSFFGLLDPK